MSENMWQWLVFQLFFLFLKKKLKSNIPHPKLIPLDIDKYLLNEEEI